MPALPRLSVISAALICTVMLSGCSEESKMIDLDELLPTYVSGFLGTCSQF